MSQARRRYPRLTLDKQGALDYRVPAKGRGEPELVRIPVEIRTISCEGVGVSLVDQRWPLKHGTSVTLSFVADDRRFELPGRVIWTASPTQPAPFDVGIHFQLALAGNAIRQSYATWIVDLSKRAQVPLTGDLARR